MADDATKTGRPLPKTPSPFAVSVKHLALSAICIWAGGVRKFTVAGSVLPAWEAIYIVPTRMSAAWIMTGEDERILLVP